MCRQFILLEIVGAPLMHTLCFIRKHTHLMFVSILSMKFVFNFIHTVCVLVRVYLRHSWKFCTLLSNHNDVDIHASGEAIKAKTNNKICLMCRRQHYKINWHYILVYIDKTIWQIYCANNLVLFVAGARETKKKKQEEMVELRHGLKFNWARNL